MLHVAPMDGMGRTMMITSQTIRAPLVVKPHGRCSFYVVNGTQLLTKTALDASLIVDPELRVGDEMLSIIAANNIGIGKRNAPFDKFFNVSLALGDYLADMLHPLAGSFNLLASLLVGVQMKKGEAYT